jgi:hypothetical protein
MKSILASFVFLAACSTDPLEPGAGDDPGGGTRTLHVDGSATAHPRVSNARAPGEFDTDFSISVELNGQRVAVGTVTVESRSAKTSLTFVPDNGGEWTGTAPAYDEVYRLDVVAGADEVRGVIVDGPDIHTFTAPTQGAALDSTIANDVKWSRDESADQCTIRAENIDRLTIADNGNYSLPAGALKAEKDKTRENTITLRRANTIVPAGATGDSSFSVSVENELDVIANANPAL